MTAPTDRQAADLNAALKYDAETTPECQAEVAHAVEGYGGDQPCVVCAHLAGQAHGRAAAWGGKCPKHGQYVGVCASCVAEQAERDGRAAVNLDCIEVECSGQAELCLPCAENRGRTAGLEQATKLICWQCRTARAVIR